MIRTSPVPTRIARAALGGLSLAGLVLATPVLAACGARSEGGEAPAAERSAGERTDGMSRYVQTWSKPYDRTSCAEWTTRMTDRQRWTAALDMLKDARAADDAFAALPADRLVGRFGSALNARCASAAADTAAQAGAQVYLAAKHTYQP